MKKISQILVLIILVSCSNNNHQELKSSQIAKSVFTNNEIRDLKIIMDFFTEQISDSEYKNNGECYQRFFERMKNNSDSGIFEIKIPFENQTQMYEKISDTTFKNIWVLNKSWKRDSPHTLKHIGIKYDCKYVDFLELLGKEYEVVSNYYKGFMSCGDICPTMVADVLINYDQYDIQDERIRLLIAIHYLTLNDQYKRKEKY